MSEQMEQILKMLPLVNKAADGILRVRELHKPTKSIWIDGTTLSNKEKCDHCLFVYPCPTIKALDGDQS